jgi:hypothetical protein
MSAYASLTAPQLLALLAKKRKEQDELFAALTAAISAAPAPAPAPKKARKAPAKKKAAAPAPAASTVPPIYVGKFVDEGGDDDLASYTICSDLAKFDQLSAEEKSQFCTLTSLGISDADQATWRALHAREEEMADDDGSLTEERLEERDALEEELDKMHILIVHALRRKAASA